MIDKALVKPNFTDDLRENIFMVNVQNISVPPEKESDTPMCPLHGSRYFLLLEGPLHQFPTQISPTRTASFLREGTRYLLSHTGSLASLEICLSPYPLPQHISWSQGNPATQTKAIRPDEKP